MASPLQSYFATLAKELNIELENTMVQPDNARTIKGSFDESLLGSSSEFSRWVESSCSSDVSLCIPGRRSSIDNNSFLGNNTTATKETYLEPTMSTTERWLKDLPTDSEEPSNDEIPVSPFRVRSFDNDMRAEENETDEGIPRLKGCRFADDEKYPVSNLLVPPNHEGLIQYPKSSEDQDPAPTCLSEDSREDASAHANMQRVLSVKRESQALCENDVKARLKMKPRKCQHSPSIHRQKRHLDPFKKGLLTSSLRIDRSASFE